MDLWTFCEMGCQLQAYGCSFTQLGKFLFIYYLLILIGLPKDWFVSSLICKYTTIYLLTKGPHDLQHQDNLIQSSRLPILTAFLSLLYHRLFSIFTPENWEWFIYNPSSMPRLCTVFLRRQNFGLGQALHITCMVPACVIKNCFLVRLKHRAKKGLFTWNGVVFSTKIYCLNTKMHIKGYFGHNRSSFSTDSFTLTGEFTKKGHFGHNKKPFYIHFFGKTTAFM